MQGLTRSAAFKQHDEAYSRMIFKRYFALYSDLGTAKTFMLLRDFLATWQAGRVDALCVIAPVDVHRQWIEKELPATTDLECETAAWPDLPPMARSDKPRIFTVYPEAFRRVPKPPKRKKDETRSELIARRRKWRESYKDVYEIIKEFLQSGRVGLVVDESQMLMHANSKTSKRIRTLKPYAFYRRIASGNPAPGGMLFKYYPQYTFLSSKILDCTSSKDFDERYTELGGFKGKQREANKNEDDFYKRVGPWTYTVALEDCVDMPERTWLKFPVDLTIPQKKLIEQVREEFKAELDGETVFMPMVLQRLTRIQQIACGFLPYEVEEDAESGKVIRLKWLPENRTKALENVLDRTRGKVIVWSRFTPCINRLTKHFGDAAVMYRGGMDREERADNKERFQRDPKILYLFAQPKSAGRGTDGLQHASRFTFYWSNSYDSDLRLQTERRTWRLGQSRACVYGDFIASGTYDAQIRRTVMQGVNVSKDILQQIARWARA